MQCMCRTTIHRSDTVRPLALPFTIPPCPVCLTFSAISYSLPILPSHICIMPSSSRIQAVCWFQTPATRLLMQKVRAGTDWRALEKTLERRLFPSCQAFEHKMAIMLTNVCHRDNLYSKLYFDHSVNLYHNPLLFCIKNI